MLCGQRSVYGPVHPGIFLDLTSSLSVFLLKNACCVYLREGDAAEASSGRRESMSLLDKLADRASWERFYDYKCSLAVPGDFTKQLRGFIDDGAYLPVCAAIEAGKAFPLPRMSVISKQSTQKKRTVFTYPDAENMVLKLLTYLLLRQYDGLFADGLYSFRPGRTAKDAIRMLRAVPGIAEMYSYKADVSDYFNSIPVEKLLPMLREALAEDPRLYAFLSGLLEEPNAIHEGRIVQTRKGIMAGTPLSSFYANLYLSDMDRFFAEQDILYSRYSDDIIVFADTREKTEEYRQTVLDFLREKGLGLNPDKESFSGPEDGFVYLGFSYKKGIVDIAPASVVKLKAKMRRKARALARWGLRNGIDPEKTAKAFIRIFNRKLLETSPDSDLTWSYWFFPSLNTDKSLRAVDHYAQECVRYLISGTRTKARFNVRYGDMKQLGYKSLVHEYYRFGEE